ncbi:O-antigen ligase family protein [Granulosicoccus sp. 3-233]|uniref:O-antigen ligase family protein n=1 Tax=Granulosicoccus sp. 3-233 TaxID=3417969 RepID=UPI003D329DED
MNLSAQHQVPRPALATYQAPYRVPLLASLMLVLTLLQGTSFTLTLAVRSPFAGDLPVTLVTLLWLVMYLTSAVALLASFGLNWLTWLVRYRLALILVVAGTAFSTAWSVDPNLTIERSVHLIGTTLLAIYLGFSLPLSQILRISATTLGLLMFGSALAAWFMPSLGLEQYEGQLVWAGITASKNTLGFWSAITALLLSSLCFWPISTARRVTCLILIVPALLCLYFSVSATSALALICATLVMLYLHTTRSLRMGMLSMSVLGLLVAALLAMAFSYIDTAELIGRSGDLTGRGDVWQQTWQLILDRPLTGYGYGTLWYPTDDSVWIQQSLTDFSWTVFHAHNGLLQIASEIGLPLTALAVFMIVQQLIELFHCQYQRPFPGVLFALGFMIALLVSNYSEARLLVNRELYWILFVTLPISMLQQVTLSSSLTRSQTPAFGLPGDMPGKLAKSRERTRQRRSLKKRLLLQRRPVIMNNDDDESVLPLTDSQGQPLLALDKGTTRSEEDSAGQGIPATRNDARSQ